MNIKTSSKSYCGMAAPYVLLVSAFCLAITMTTVHKRVNMLNNIEESMDRRLRNIEMIEGRIGRLQNQMTSFTRRRRDTSSSENQTTNAPGKTDQDDSDEKDDFQNVEKMFKSTINYPMDYYFSTTTKTSIDQNDGDSEENGERSKDAYRVKERKTCEKCEPIGGAMYTRWGRTTCGNDSELVYEGVVGGSHYTHTGGAVNPLCLPRDPIWNKYEEGVQAYAHIYGSEYERQSDMLFSKKNARKLFDENMPCAVCRSSTRQSAVMIPARNLCHLGWTSEYQGYLMAGHISHNKGSKYICVDESPETTDSGYRDEDGQLFYTVEAHCGSLPCPDYIHGRELTCVVCTK